MGDGSRVTVGEISDRSQVEKADFIPHSCNTTFGKANTHQTYIVYMIAATQPLKKQTQTKHTLFT